MTNFTSRTRVSYTAMAVLTVLLMFTTLNNVSAQFRNYGIVYSANIKGGVTMFGNTLMAKYNNNGTSVNTTAMNGNSANGNSNTGNDNSNMRWVDIDGNTNGGEQTRNSSTSDLILPAGTNHIKLARLYWGGKAYKSNFDVSADSNKTIKIRYGTTGNYFTYNASQIDKHDTTISGNLRSQYQAYTDITNLVEIYGAGTYSVGNAPLSQGTDANNNGNVSYGGIYGGWCIVVVYENQDFFNYYNSIRVYDGFEQVYAGGAAITTSVTLTGLNVPSGPLSLGDARMGAMCWEGDANITGDSLRINDTYYSDAVNQLNNPWKGTISNDGVHVTTKNPNYTNQMGIDIDQFNVGTGYGIVGGATSVKLSFRTESDQYFPGLFTFQIKAGDPTVSLVKKVTDANLNHLAEPNEVLTYTISGKNVGVGNANKCVVTDTLPSTVTYVPGSLKFIYGPGNYEPGNNITGQTDAQDLDSAEFINESGISSVRFRIGTGVTTAPQGGVLAINDSFKVQFQVTVNDPGAGNDVPPIINTARIVSYSDADVLSTNDATAAIEGPQGGPLPLTLKSFSGHLLNNNQTALNWSTSMEISTDHFDVQRSLDGRTFTTVATKQAAGNSYITNNYNLTDDVANINSTVIYYRLRQVDQDGKLSFSKVISVRLKASNNNFTVSPNPFNQYLNINIDWNKEEITTIKVLNLQGTEMIVKNVTLTKGTNYISISELANLPAGNYLIQLNNGTEKLVKMISKQ